MPENPVMPTAVLSRSSIRLPVNWASVLAFSLLWVYGYYGVFATHRDPVTSHGLTATFVLCLVYFLAMRSNGFRDYVIVARTDVFIFLLYFLILFAISYSQLSRDITVDQIAHAQASHLHSMTLIPVLSRMFPSIGTLPFALVMRLISVALLCALLVTAVLIASRARWAGLAVIVLFIAFRLVVHYNSGGSGPHPPLRLVPLFAASSLFGIHGVVFRVPSLLGLAALMLWVQRSANRHVPLIDSLLLGLACGTIPILFHVGTLVEASIWSALLFTGFLVSLPDVEGGVPETFLTRWFPLFAVGCLMRQSVLALIVPLAVIYGAYVRQDRPRLGRALTLLSPILVMAFFFARSLYAGTPSTAGDELLAESVVERIWISISHGISYDILRHTIWWPLLLCGAIGIVPVRSRRVALSALPCLLFVAVYSEFYAASPWLWGLGRYQAEYAVPFIIFGMFRISLFASKWRHARYLWQGTLAVLVVTNVLSYLSLEDRSREITISYPAPHAVRTIVSDHVNDYRPVMKEVREAGFADGVLVFSGWTYGAFPAVLSGYTVNEVGAYEEKYHRRLTSGEFDVDTMASDQTIHIILVDRRDRTSLARFEALGWRSGLCESEARASSFYTCVMRPGLSW